MPAEQLRWYNRRLSAAVPGETGDLVIQFRTGCPDHRSVSAGTGDCESFLPGAPRLTQGQTPSQVVLEPLIAPVNRHLKVRGFGQLKVRTLRLLSPL
jgi:hypothetical protein